MLTHFQICVVLPPLLIIPQIPFKMCQFSVGSRDYTIFEYCCASVNALAILVQEMPPLAQLAGDNHYKVEIIGRKHDQHRFQGVKTTLDKSKEQDTVTKCSMCQSTALFYLHLATESHSYLWP